MSKKIKNLNDDIKSFAYMDITDEEVINMSEELSKEQIEEIKDNVLSKMHEQQKEQKTIYNKSTKLRRYNLKAAVIAIAFAILIPTGTYASVKLNVFDYFFNNSTSNKYVAEVSKKEDISQYQDETEDLKVIANSFVYSDDTDSGILQFTIINKKNNGKKLFEELKTYDKYYNDWQIGTKDMTEIATIADSKNYQLFFDIDGIESMDERTYLNKEKSTENKKVCTMIFNDFKQNDLDNADLKLNVYDSNDDFDKPILNVDIPKAESLPSYVWKNKDGNTRLALTSMDYLLKDPPKSSIYEETNEVILDEVYIKLKDNSEYVILSDKNKIYNIFYGTQGDNGTWTSFVDAIDLDNVEYISFDDKKFYTKDATKSE